MATMTTTSTQRGFKASCPFCGEDGHLFVDTQDVSQLRCGSCDAEFDTDAIRDLIQAWQRLLAWLSTAPEIEN